MGNKPKHDPRDTVSKSALYDAWGVVAILVIVIVSYLFGALFF